MRNFMMAIVLLLPLNLWATEVTQSAPDKIFTFPLGNSMKLVGKARFTVLFWDIYDSTLYSPSGEFNDDTDEFVLNITYLKDINNKDLLDRTVEQWKHLGLPKSAYQPYLKNLLTLWPDIYEGDSLTMHVDNQGTRFYHNQSLTGSITDLGFGQMFASIWLSPNTSQPAIRAQLLGRTE